MERGHSIITLNLIISILFGVFVGVVFPFYVRAFGIQYANNTQFFIFFLSCVLAGGVVGLFAFIINKVTIIRIVKLLGRELKDIAEGQGDLTRTIEIDSHDEVGQLAFWFNAFVQRLDEMVGKTKKLASTMRENGIELNINLRHAGGILQAVLSNLESVDKFSESQAEMMGTAKDQLQTFSRNITDISKNSKILADNFKDFAYYVQKQSNLSQDLANGMDSLRNSLGDQNSDKTSDRSETRSDLLGITVQFTKESTRSIDEQAQRFTRIEKLLEEIEDIAESTHLLSINASIEAARAGETGRGFTIVALQIRNLATNSGSLTSEIRGQIEAIMNVTKSSGTHLVDLRSILNKHMENVLTDMQQLANSASDIGKTVEIIGSMQRKLKERIEDISHGFSEVNISQESLLQPIEELGQYTEKLRENVSRISVGSDEIEKVTKGFFAQGAATEEQAQTLVKSMQDYQTSQDRVRSSRHPTKGTSKVEKNLGERRGGESLA